MQLLPQVLYQRLAESLRPLQPWPWAAAVVIVVAIFIVWMLFFVRW